ncbi:MAG: tetratricopeptide repeat protein [Phycisphaerales bacterium]|nr:tetratricopeptide repeat protein [Phycisphaerales bacterium]
MSRRADDSRRATGDGTPDRESSDFLVRTVIVLSGLVGIAVAGWTFVRTPAGGDGPAERLDRERSGAGVGVGGSVSGPRLDFSGGRLGNTIGEVEEQVRQSPARVDAWIRLGDLRQAEGDDEGARGAYQRAVTMIEEALPGLLARPDRRSQAYAWYRLGQAQTGLGDTDAARASFEQASDVQRSLAREGNQPGEWYDLACFAALAGQRERALRAFERSVEFRWNNRRWALEDPDLESIREEERFRAAVERIEESDLRLIGG